MRDLREGLDVQSALPASRKGNSDLNFLSRVDLFTGFK